MMLLSCSFSFVQVVVVPPFRNTPVQVVQGVRNDNGPQPEPNAEHHSSNITIIQDDKSLRQQVFRMLQESRSVTTNHRILHPSFITPQDVQDLYQRMMMMKQNNDTSTSTSQPQEAVSNTNDKEWKRKKKNSNYNNDDVISSFEDDEIVVSSIFLPTEEYLSRTEEERFLDGETGLQPQRPFQLLQPPPDVIDAILPPVSSSPDVIVSSPLQDLWQAIQKQTSTTTSTTMDDIHAEIRKDVWKRNESDGPKVKKKKLEYEEYNHQIRAQLEEELDSFLKGFVLPMDDEKDDESDIVSRSSTEAATWIQVQDPDSGETFYWCEKTGEMKWEI